MFRRIQIVFLMIALVYLGGMAYQLFLVADYHVNQEAITAEFCVNKDKPEMHCNGHCHLKKSLEEVETVIEAKDPKGKTAPQLKWISVDGCDSIEIIKSCDPSSVLYTIIHKEHPVPNSHKVDTMDRPPAC